MTASAGSAAAPARVLMIVENLPVPFDRRVWLEAQTLRDAGYAVSVICPQMGSFTRSRELLDGIQIYRHPLPFEGAHGALGFLLEYSTALFFQIALTIWIFIRWGIDVVHACNPPDTIFLIGLLLKPLGVRFIFDQHDINPELYLAKYNQKDFFYRLLLLLEKLTYRTANVVISTNESYRSIALTRGRKNRDDVFIVRSAPDTNRFMPVLPETSLKMGRPHLVVYLGVMGKQEGLDLLLQSVNHLVINRNRQDISFLFIGDGPERRNLELLVDQMHLGRYVTFAGRIPDDELLTCLSTADVCVNPDRFNEMNDKSTMNKIMEYMAVGKPIVQFDMTEGRYSAGNASLYAVPDDPVDFAEKILTLLDNPHQRKEMGDAGLRRIQEHLDWKFSSAVSLEAYTRALQPANIPVEANEVA